MTPSLQVRTALPLALALLAAGACRSPRQRAPLPVVIDTDPALGVIKGGTPREVDDALAILAALNSEELRPLGITVVFGNADLGRTLRTAEELIRVKGAGVGVYRGARSPPLRRGRIPITPASEFIASRLRRERLTILALGPLANLASVAANFPESLANIERVVAVMGRSAERSRLVGTGPAHPDFNYFRDPRSARLVVESGVPMVLVPAELSRRVAVGARDLDAVRRRGTPAAEHIHRLSQEWLGFWLRSFPDAGGFHPADSLAVGYLLRPDLLRCEPRGYRFVEPGTDPAAGGDASSPRPAARSGYAFELGRGLAGRRLEFCHSFAPGQQDSLVRELLDRVY